MSKPSPIYLLLTNPGWETTSAYADVLAGVAGGWDFDPNETHQEKALLPLLLVRWNQERRREPQLLDLVDHLLQRGASAADALAAPFIEKVAWNHAAGVQSLLVAMASGLPHDQAILGARLVALMGQDLGAAGTPKAVEELLADHGGWDACVHGVPAVAWLALQVCREGCMAGWTEAPHTTAEHYARQLRALRGVVSGANPSTTDIDSRFSLACGLLLAYSYADGTQVQSAAADALHKNAVELLKGIDPLAAFDRLMAREDYQAPGHRMRLAMAAIRGLVPEVGNPDDAWALIARALPHLYQGGLFLGSQDSLATVLTQEIGLPPPSFYDQLPVNDAMHDALLRMLSSTFRTTLYGDAAVFRQSTLQVLDDMAMWAAGGSLAMPDMHFYTDGNYGLLNNPQAMAALDRYATAAWAQSQASHLDSATQRAPGRAPSRRI